MPTVYPDLSVKDRVARSMMETAEESGAIVPGQTILEPTSGNTGISLAMICRRKRYPLKVVMPDNVTAERTELLRMYGAEIVYSEGANCPSASLIGVCIIPLYEETYQARHGYDLGPSALTPDYAAACTDDWEPAASHSGP